MVAPIYCVRRGTADNNYYGDGGCAQRVEMRVCGLMKEGIEGEECGGAARETSEDAICDASFPLSSMLCLSSSIDRTPKRNELTRQ